MDSKLINQIRLPVFMLILLTGKSTVLHRSSAQWTPQHNRQSVDQPGQPPTWGRLHRGDDVHWIPQHIPHDHEFQSRVCSWILWP